MKLFKKHPPTEHEREFLVRTTDKKILGPFTIEELEKQIRGKKVNPLDEASISCGAWTPIKHLTQLLKVLAEVPSHPVGEMTQTMTQELELEKPTKPKPARRVKPILEPIKRGYETKKRLFGMTRALIMLGIGVVLAGGILFYVTKERRVITPQVETPREVQSLPEAFKNAYQRGRVFEEAALFREAKEEYAKALRIVPNNISVGIRLAALEIRDRKFGEAEETLSKLNIEELTIEQKKEITNYRAVVALALGRDEDGARFAQQSVVFNDKFAPAYFNLGKSLFRQRKYFDAKKAFEKSVIYQPNQTFPYLYLGFTLGLTKKWDDGVDEFRNATQVNPRETLPYFYLAFGLRSLQREKEMSEVLESMTNLDPDYEENHLTDDRYSRGDNEYKNILSEFFRSINSPSLSTNAKGELSLLQFIYGDKELGINALEQLVRDAPQNAGLHALLGYVNLRQGRIDEAKLRLQEALRYDYSDELAQTLMGDLLIGTGDPEGAVSHYNRVLSINAYNLSANQGMAVYYFERKQYQEAKRIEEQILQIDQTYIPARRGLLRLEEVID